MMVIAAFLKSISLRTAGLATGLALAACGGGSSGETPFPPVAPPTFPKDRLISPVFYGLEQVRDRPQMEAVAEFDLIALWNLPVKPFLFRAPMTAQLHRQ
jgi:hypothetical protein